ncbi:MAG: DNA polymerase I [Akkermansiaceae bacterium]|jgi:DNA polymerase I|nr:DNA polymerase I [Akkermansiaceae bacterium]
MARRLFLLDGMALVYRAHFALIRNPIYTSKGINSSAIYGFTNTLVDLLGKQEPTHIAVVFDTPAPTERHEIFPEYKAQRDAMPEDLSIAIPEVKKLIKAFNIPVIEMDGYEADDIIGTLAKRAVKDDNECEVFMVTPDKDFAQLVEDRVKIFKPGKAGNEPEIIGIEAIKDHWNVQRSEQVIDILGLWGDASDNIPGVPGIGEKTAKKLVAKYGGVEQLIENIDELKGKQKENVENNKEQAILSKKLATIIIDVPVDLDWDDLLLEDKNNQAISDIFIEFEFNSLGKRLLGKEFVAGRGYDSDGSDDGSAEVVLKNIESVEHDYYHIGHDDESKRRSEIDNLMGVDSFCFDTETTGTDPMHDELLGIAISCSEGKALYFECPRDESQRKNFIKDFTNLFSNPKTEKIGHNLKFDLAVLGWSGLNARGPFFDTMLAHTLVFPDQKHSMDYASESMLGYTPISMKSLIDEEDSNGQLSLIDSSVADIEASKLAEYAAEDADVTYQLAQRLRPLLKEKGQEKVFYEIECPLISVLVSMESEGISLDQSVLDETRESLTGSINDLRAEITSLAGREFNLNSPKQLGEVLFDDLKLVDKPKKTKTGQYKTDEAVLTSLAPKHRVVEAILEYRESAKLKNTYVDALPNSIAKRTGRVHSNFGQLVTATGRLVSNSPNLQNIPVRTAQGREIRKAFVARGSDYKILAADYSQIELRVMASISGDDTLQSAFSEGLDIHSATASKVYSVDLDSVTSDMRRGAKTVNFGIIYGISAFGLSQRLNVSRSEASELIDSYFEQYPKVKEFMSKTIEFAKENGYVETITGRRRYLRDINSSNAMIRSAAERTAINTPIQGTAADMIKLAMTRVQVALDEGQFDTKMILQVHDELLFDMAIGEETQIKEMVVEEMKSALPLKVPITVDVGTGDNWLEAH